jgi:hypothetical protein
LPKAKNPRLKNMNTISFQSVYNTTAARGSFKLGERAQTADGRQWVYAQASATLATSLIAVPNAVTTITDIVSTSNDSQGRTVYITDNSSWTTGQFEDAIGVVSGGTGVGQTFKIRTNSATVLTLYPETPITTALDTTSDLSIRTMSIVTPAAVTSKLQSVVGAAQTAFATSDYGWLLTNGDGRAVAGGTLVVGAGFTSGAGTAGQVIPNVATESSITAQTLGFALVAATSGQGALVRYIVR